MAELPPHWTIHFDEQYQTYYYYNESTFQTQWQYPTPDNECDDDLERSTTYTEEFIEKQFDDTFETENTQDYQLIKKLDENEEQEERIELYNNPRKKQDVIKLVGKRNYDYVGAAMQYKNEEPFRTYSTSSRLIPFCVLCNKTKVEDVFFPCEHRCVCRKCIQSENIIPDSSLRKNPSGYSNCSLCASIIKLILPYDNGNEVEKYWEWVYEVPVHIPTGFMRNFRHSAAVIKAVYRNDDDETNYGCTIGLCKMS